MNKNTRPVRVENGSVYGNISGCIIENPAVIIDEAAGTMHKYGDAAQVRKTYEDMCAKFRTAGIPHGLMLIEMSDLAMTREEQAYVINRCVMYSASGFQTELCRHMRQGDALEWIRSEMIRIPISAD